MRYLIINNVQIRTVPKHDRAILKKGVIARKRKRVRNGYMMRVYHCGQLFFEFIIGCDDFSRAAKPLCKAKNYEELEDEFSNNMQRKKESYLYY